MVRISAVQGDITRQRVDAVVNAANTRMRGGGGVDGAIHRAGGPAVLRDCIARFPDGLATGDAGWTTAGDLPATWVIHTVGPNHRAGQTDRELLVSCYRRSLEVAAELGARTVAFPLISAGVYGWPLEDAITAAVRTIGGSEADIDDAIVVAYDRETYRRVERGIEAERARRTPLRILQSVRRLHERGYEDLRIEPGMSASGGYWRVRIATTATFAGGQTFGVESSRDSFFYTTGNETEFAGIEVVQTTSIDDVADRILAALPDLRPTPDAAYAGWYAGLIARVEQRGALPIAYADWFDDTAGWEIGWGSGERYPRPPR